MILEMMAMMVLVQPGEGFIVDSPTIARTTVEMNTLQQYRSSPLLNSLRGTGAPLQPLASTRIKQPVCHSHSCSSHRQRTPGSSNPTHLKSNNNSDNSSSEPAIDYTKLTPKLYPERWTQLAYLSMLALLSDWICFSVAAEPSTFEAAYAGHSAANLIDIFLFTNVASCFLVTDIVGKIGLKKSIKGASAVMAVGCFLRSGVGFLTDIIPSVTSTALTTTTTIDTLSSTSISTPSTLLADAGLVPYWSVIAGTVLVGAAQPFFQCTPPMLSATWFASDERATSTAIALNFNQIGIATAFLVGGSMATDPAGLARYFGLISVACAVVTCGTLLQFRDGPPVPPSSSEIAKLIRGEEQPPFSESVKKFFKTPGFSYPLAAFIMSIAITNIVGTFIDEVMERGGVTEQLSIDLAGAGFEFGILFGGIIIGGYVDKTKRYKSVTLTCILASIFLLLPLGLTEHAIGKEPLLLVLALVGLGVVAGPIQPINAELAVDVTYPSDETAVESVQQIGGNLVSALLVPLAGIGAKQDYQLLPTNEWFASDIRGDVVLLVAISVMTWIYFSGFDSPLRRTMADKGELDVEGEGVAIDVDIVEDLGAVVLE